MAWRVPLRWRLIAAGAGATLLVLAAGGLLFVVSGVYNVAASRGHFWITRQIIQLTLERSLELRSWFVPAPPPNLDDPGLVQLGAAHYQGECALCHGEPGRLPNPIARHMLPRPPFLGDGAQQWTRDEQFWIVKHGLKMTGMPSWTAVDRDEEIWAVVAFLQKLPMPREDYLKLALGNAVRRQSADAGNAEPGREPLALTRCVRCHEDEGAEPVSPHVPRLAGQSKAYLLRALRAYAGAARPSGMMQPVAGALTPDAMQRVAQFYARLPPAPKGRDNAQFSRAAIEQGERIARFGVHEGGIPPCLACHGRNSASVFPRLSGQYAPYIRAQIRLWQRGLRDETAYAEIMAPIARRLTEEQINSVAAYFASLPPFGADADNSDIPPPDVGGTDNDSTTSSP